MATIEKTQQFAQWLPEAELSLYQAGSRPPKSFHASSYVDCGRMQLYGLLGVAPDQEQEIVVQWRRDALIGNFIHATLQDWAVASGKIALLPDQAGKLQPAVEVDLSKQMTPEKQKEFARLHIGGRVDGILRRSNGDLVVWEIKTIAGKYFTPNYKRWLPEKLTHYESQVQLYMHFLNIREGLILVVDRELFLELYSGVAMVEWADCYQEYAVTYDPLFIEPELERLARLNEYLAAKKLPEGEPHRGPCKFCLYPCELKQQ